MAWTSLSGIESREFAACIQNGDTDRLVKLPGVGKKTAERLIVEMRDRLKDWQTNIDSTDSSVSSGPKIQSDPSNEAVSALLSLGYKPQEASRFVEAVAAPEMDSETIIREALKASVSK
jgi:Holliday junction DNA helicase RuvA